MKCTVCKHQQRQDIDQDLLAANATFAALSRKYGLSISALFRHKKMLKHKMAQAEARLQQTRNQEILFKYNEFLETVRQLSRTAADDGDSRLALQAIGAGTRILNFMTKLEVQFDPDTIYRVLASPQWVSQDSLLPTDPRIITGARQALADDLFFPCLEIPPDPQAEAWDKEDAAAADRAQIAFLKTRNSALETLPPAPASPGAGSPGISSLFPLPCSLAPTPAPEIEICCFPLEIAPQNQREKSAKLPKNISSFADYNQQYQSNTACEKNAARNPHVGRESAAPPADKIDLDSPLPIPTHIPAQPSFLETRKPTPNSPPRYYPGTAPANPPPTGPTTSQPTQNHRRSVAWLYVPRPAGQFPVIPGICGRLHHKGPLRPIGHLLKEKIVFSEKREPKTVFEPDSYDEVS